MILAVMISYPEGDVQPINIISLHLEECMDVVFFLPSVQVTVTADQCSHMLYIVSLCATSD